MHLHLSQEENLLIQRLKYSPIILAFLILAFYFWDIGNLNGMRQGTEGLYVQVVAEMFQRSSILTPFLDGVPHWSKPPLQFWLSYPLFTIFGEPSLGIARASIAILTLFCTWFISTWAHRNFLISKSLLFIFLLGSLGFIKYSRTYMMEMPLALLTFLGAILFYDFSRSPFKTRNLILASGVSALSVLVKGPVSLVMISGTAGLFYLHQFYFNKASIPYKKIFYWLILTLVFSSIWFLLSYLEHGYEFLEYFFIRENLGKFASKSFPIRNVFQGLLLYSLPWCLFIPMIIGKCNRVIKSHTTPERNHLLYLFYGFLFSFSLWLIPNQRSHHYALPALPFFLMLIYLGLNRYFLFSQQSDRIALIVSKIFISSFNVLILVISLLSIIFFFDDTKAYFLGFSGTAIAVLIFLFFLWSKRINSYLLISLQFFIIGNFWTFNIPAYYLPIVPDQLKSQIVPQDDLFLVYRRPYYFEQGLNRSVTHIPSESLVSKFRSAKGYSIAPRVLFEAADISTEGALHKWRLWRRSNKLPDVIKALRSSSLSPLQEDMVLMQNQAQKVEDHEKSVL